MSGNKRKRSSPHRRNPRTHSPPSELPLHARPLRIQAYEAELVRNRPNLSDQLESPSEGGNRGGLIRWGDHDIWVDRFDVRLLLESLENIATPGSIQLDCSLNDPLADVGWDDLPSDAEDTFFLTPREVDEYQHDKRRKLLEKERQDRLRALAAEDEANDPGALALAPESLWGGSDEEPDDVQANLMRRTGAHIRASPNPTQLEMRILANHGADPRFAFLRGRWKSAWARIRQGEASPDDEEPKRSMMGLSAYASDSSDNGRESGDEREVDQQGAHVPPEQGEMEKVKAERRARAKDWARKRKESQLGQVGSSS